MGLRLKPDFDRTAKNTNTMNNPPAEYCCFNCFTHPTLLEIVKHGADTEGQCDFCGSESVLLLHVSALYDSLNNAVRM
jgi:hypothetical protein